VFLVIDISKGWPSRKIVVFKTKCLYGLSGRITAVPALWQMFALRSHPVGAGRDPAHSKVPNCLPFVHAGVNGLTRRSEILLCLRYVCALCRAKVLDNVMLYTHTGKQPSVVRTFRHLLSRRATRWGTEGCYQVLLQLLIGLFDRNARHVQSDLRQLPAGSAKSKSQAMREAAQR